jgi:uncharacterized protein
VTSQKDVVRRYTEAFVAGDLDAIVSCLTPDVVWAVHGDRTFVGRDAFASEVDNGGGPAPTLHLDRLIEEGHTVAAVGRGSVRLGAGQVDVVYSEVFTFTDGLVSRLDTFHVQLGELPA